jgi:activator of HSP90 ATPase
MPKTIVQKVIFKNTTPQVLYNLYLDAKQHHASTGVTARIKEKEGSSFSVYDGYATGRNLQLIKDKLIVQSWRASDWTENDIDSTFVIRLEPKGKDVVVHATHANVPDNQAKSLDKGWHDYYWTPWKKFLKASSSAKKV